MRRRLENVIGVRTTFTGNLKKGKIVLQYSSQDELEAIYDIMAQLEQQGGRV